MIEVSYYNSGVTIKGHANYAEMGKDIVCAGVSTLVQTLIQSIEELTEDKIEYVMSLGMVEIKYRNLSEKAQTLLNSFFIGLEMIAEAYPNNMQMSKH